VLLSWSKEDHWTIRDAVAGTLVVGATGSGKSSGPGQTLARAFLTAGFGGLVLTCKPDERAEWEGYCRAVGREKDVLVFGPGSGHGFNFLDEELRFAGAGAGLTENVVQLLGAVGEVSERGVAGGGREDDQYWRQASRQLQRNVIDLLTIATGQVSVPAMYRVVVSAPTSLEQLRSEAWRAQSFCFRLLEEADRKARTPQQDADLAMVADYFMLEFPALSDKTRSVITSTFTSLIDVLNRGVLRTLFCGETSVTPEMAREGKVIILDLPIKRYAEVGQIAQVLFKSAFQRAMERTPVSESTRPVFLWADEAQFTLTSQDMLFATTCRGARVATVLLTQNISNIEAALGAGEKGKAEAASLLGNLNSKFFLANGDPVTNEWASTLCGRTLQHFANSSMSHDPQAWVASALGMGAPGQHSAGMSEAYEFDLQPVAFSELRTGGPDANWQVDAVLFQNGRRFRANGRMWLPVTFRQNGGSR